MKKLSLNLLFMSISCLLAAAEIPYVRAERQSAVYNVGEEIKFNVKNTSDNVTYTINDGRTTTAPQPLKAEGFSVTAKEPGFIFVTINYGAAQPTYAGAAIEPEKIIPGAILPDDFDEFWDNELAALRKEPLEIIKETPLDSSLLPPGIVGFDVEVRRNGVTATGFLTYPKGAAPQSLPGCLSFLGASKVSAEIYEAAKFSRSGAIAFNLNFHGIANSTLDPKEYSKTPEWLVAKRKVHGYNYKNAHDRQAYAMREVFLRVVIAADYLMQRAEFNKKALVSCGGSLGGCQALICAALIPEVTMCVSNATAMCDHLGSKVGHLPGWPELLKRDPQNEKTSAYFDVVNFAHRVKCPTYMAVGFVDPTCPPASTYAAYNTLTCPKKMQHSVTSKHGGKCLDPSELGVFQAWRDDISRYLRKNK